MRISVLFLASAALLATACNAEKGASNTASGPEVTAAPVAAPNNGDWSTIVTKTPEGGFLMGNPNAKVKLIEFGSMTCPHCAEFEEQGGKALIDNYVKKGLVSWEFRNYVRDPWDLTASIIARCNGAKSFFPLMRALYKDQTKWVAKVQGTPQEQLEALQNLPPNQQFLKTAKIAGFQDWAAMRGVPAAKSTQCLSDENTVNQLVQWTSDATTQFPDFKGTPAFVINGTMVDLGQVTAAEVWPALESKIKTALGG